MDRSKSAKQHELDQLLNAVRDLDRSLAQLRGLLQESLRTQAQADGSLLDESLTPHRTLH